MTNSAASALDSFAQRWAELETNAYALITDAESAVERWSWADGSAVWERPEPLLAERRGNKPIVKATTSVSEPLDYLVRYGFDATSRVVIARRVSGGTVSAPFRTDDSVWTFTPEGRSILLEFTYEGLHGAQAVRLQRLTLPLEDRDAPQQVLYAGRPESMSRSREWYERSEGRVRRIHEESWGDDGWVPRWLFEVAYADGDDAAAVVATKLNADATAAGEPIVTYRRSSPRAVRTASKRLREELPARVKQWAERVAPDEPVFALALLYSFEAPSVPPALGLASERERHALLTRPGDTERLWNPAEWELLDSDPAELSADGLDVCWQQLAQEWESSRDDRQPRAFLVNIAKLLTKEKWQVPRHTSPFVIFAVDDEMVDLDRNLDATVPRAARAAIETVDD